jgi:hypothetical protein
MKESHDLLEVRKKVFNELLLIATVRPAECLEWEEGKLELTDKIPKRIAAAICSIERSSAGVKLRFHDKLRAIDLLLQHMEKIGTTQEEKNNLIEAILAATSAAMNMDDIPETGREQDEIGIFVEQGS